MTCTRAIHVAAAVVVLGSLMPAPAERYLYDAAGRLAAVRHQDGTQTTYTYDANDNLMEVQTGAAPALPLDEQFTTGAGSAVSYATPGTGREASAGYGLLESESGAAPYGMTLIRYRAGDVLQSEAALPAVAPTTRARVVMDRWREGAGSNMGIVLVNPSASAARVTMLMRDADGSERSRGVATLPGGAHRSLDVASLGDLAPGLTATSVEGGSLEVESDTPIVVAGLRLGGNSRGDLLLSAALAADFNRPAGGGAVLIPHLADGGGFRTSVQLMNPTAVSVSGVVEFFDDAGLPLALSTGGEPAAVVPYAIAAGGVFYLETSGSGAPTVGGWARITATEGEQAPIAMGAFQYERKGMTVSGTNVPAAEPTKLARTYADQTGGRETVIALANPGEEAAVVLRAFALNGTSQAAQPTVVLLPKGGHRSVLASVAFPDLPGGFQGVIEIAPTSPVAVANFRLVTNERGDPVFAAPPVADMTRPSPAPVVFPQVMDGGGFQSEIVLIGTGEGVHTLRFLGPDGAPMEGGQ